VQETQIGNHSPQWPGHKTETLVKKIMRARIVAQVIEHLTGKSKALNSNPSTTPSITKKKDKQD
jgi:hypothetical protein